MGYYLSQMQESFLHLPMELRQEQQMKDFAKLFRADDIGQVLVTVGKDDEGDQCVKFAFGTAAGQMEVSLGIGEVDDAEIGDLLEKITEEDAIALAREAIKDSPFSSLINRE